MPLRSLKPATSRPTELLIGIGFFVAVAACAITAVLIPPTGELAVTDGPDVIRLIAIVGLSLAGGLYGIFRRRTG